ncbi:unnamed protein product [Nesidiocoris tenuis]|uniref:Uncharacterized protein n=1 Tax=Nesidiocoris tenuis TaxID=355587 RepID=A0A6H5GXP6_9HEMI|nr:unnamed protein product [Nesidiocoris tenuis]
MQRIRRQQTRRSHTSFGRKSLKNIRSLHILWSPKKRRRDATSLLTQAGVKMYLQCVHVSRIYYFLVPKQYGN